MPSGFLDKLRNYEEEAQGFPNGYLEEEQGEGVHTFWCSQTLEQLCEHGEKTQVISQEFF